MEQTAKKKTDLRVVKTYKALTEAFFELLEEKKFEGISVNELCDRAMVRRPTFYKHFADKYEFFAFVIRQMQEQFKEQTPPGDEDGKYASRLVTVTAHMFEFLQDNVKIVDVMAKNALPTIYDLFAEQIIADLTNQIQERKDNLPESTSPEVAATFYAGAIIYTLRYWMLQKNRMPPEELLHQMMGLLRFLY